MGKKLENLCNKYLDWVGIENEGLRRLTIIILTIYPFLSLGVTILINYPVSPSLVIIERFLDKTLLGPIIGVPMFYISLLIELSLIIKFFSWITSKRLYQYSLKEKTSKNYTYIPSVKNFYNKYFDFIGVTNEGPKRLTLVSIIILGLIFPFLFDLDIEEYFEMIFLDDLEDSFFFYLLILFPSPIIVGVIIKVTNWVKEGFNK